MEHFVELIPQESENTCWAAAMAMLLQHLAGNPGASSSRPTSPFATGYTPEGVARTVGGVIHRAYLANRMLSTDFRDNFVQLAQPWFLETEFTFNNPSASEWERLLRQNGPYFLLMNDIYNDHAVVVSGINGEELTIMDPWPVGVGGVRRMARRELRPTGTVIHAGRQTIVTAPTRGGDR